MDQRESIEKIGFNIIGAAFQVRKKVGRGLKEKFYEKALAYELQQLGHHVECQVEVPALYNGVIIDNAYLADMVIDDRVIIEVKAITTMTERESRQLFTYLKLSELKLGYLINFGAIDFRPHSIRNVKIRVADVRQIRLCR